MDQSPSQDERSSQPTQFTRKGIEPDLASRNSQPSLRLFLVSYEYPPLGGGGASALQAILKRLMNRPDVRVLLVTSSYDRDYHLHRMGESIAIHRLPVSKRDAFYWRRMEIIRFIRAATTFIREHVDLSAWNLGIGFFGFPSGLIAWRLKKQLPYIIFLRGSDVPGFNRRFSLDYLFLRPLFKQIWRGASAVVVNSRGLAELAGETCPELEYEILPNGIDLNRFHPMPLKESTGPVRLAVSARLIRRKAIDELLEALYLLGEGVSPWILDIYGDGPERASLQSQAKQLGLSAQVHFHGQVDREELPKLLAQADVFVLPSHSEGMSNAVLEAMACGLPLVVTRTGGTDELLEDNGFVVSPGDTDELAAALGKIIDNPEARQVMGMRSRMLAEQKSWDIVAEEFLRICYQALRHESWD